MEQESNIKERPVQQVITAHKQQEGGGFIVRRPLPSMGFDDFDPFLLIDEMGPISYKPGEAVGAPDHPHRGFETVTYILEGEGQHEDSAGHKGFIGPGDVQWMTAGSGVVHSEMPSENIMKKGGVVHGFQIWVNLPSHKKMTAPRYQEVSRHDIPHATTDDGLTQVKVIAGEALGAKAVIDTHTPIIYQDWTLQPGAQVTTSIPEDHQAGIYVFAGSVQIGSNLETVRDGQLALLGRGEEVQFSVPSSATENARFLLLAGVPLNEPVARYGPFVMNTEAELQQAFHDYQNGRMGTILR